MFLHVLISPFVYYDDPFFTLITPNIQIEQGSWYTEIYLVRKNSVLDLYDRIFPNLDHFMNNQWCLIWFGKPGKMSVYKMHHKLMECGLGVYMSYKTSSLNIWSQIDGNFLEI